MKQIKYYLNYLMIMLLKVLNQRKRVKNYNNKRFIEIHLNSLVLLDVVDW